MSKELVIRFADETWEAFREAYEQKNNTKLIGSSKLENEARDILYNAIKAYVLSNNDEPRTANEETTCEHGASVMIPVHEWIWQDFKEMYTKRNKDKAMTDNDFIEIVHDWACRAMQHYIYDNIDDPWKLTRIYEIALSCPDIQIKKHINHQGGLRAWTISTPHRPDVQAEGINDLYCKLGEAKEYCETLKPESRATREMIREAAAIAKSVPGMLIANLRDGGYAICLDDGDYSIEAQNAEQLLREVKVAKAYWEASQKPKKGHQTARDMIRETMEKSKKDNEEVIRVDGLDQETKELLLHFIESLTIKEVSDILAKDYPCSVWDELHFIREKLRKSIAEPRRRP